MGAAVDTGLIQQQLLQKKLMLKKRLLETKLSAAQPPQEPQAQPIMEHADEQVSPLWEGAKEFGSGIAQGVGNVLAGGYDSGPARTTRAALGIPEQLAQAGIDLLRTDPVDFSEKDSAGLFDKAATFAGQHQETAGNIGANLAAGAGVQNAVRSGVRLGAQKLLGKVAPKAVRYAARAGENAIGMAVGGDPSDPLSYLELAAVGAASGVPGRFAGPGFSKATKLAGVAGEGATMGLGMAALEGRMPTAEEGAMAALPVIMTALAHVRTPSRANVAKALGVKPKDLPPELSTQAQREAAVKAAQEEPPPIPQQELEPQQQVEQVHYRPDSRLSEPPPEQRIEQPEASPQPVQEPIAPPPDVEPAPAVAIDETVPFDTPVDQPKIGRKGVTKRVDDYRDAKSPWGENYRDGMFTAEEWDSFAPEKRKAIIDENNEAYAEEVRADADRQRDLDAEDADYEAGKPQREGVDIAYGQVVDELERAGMEVSTKYRGHGNSQYITAENPKTGESFTVRVSDHDQPADGGYNADQGYRHGPSDVNVVVGTDGQFDLSRVRSKFQEPPRSAQEDAPTLPVDQPQVDSPAPTVSDTPPPLEPPKDAATAQQPRPGPDVTSTKNAVAAEERVARGLEPVEGNPERSREELLRIGQKRLDDAPETAEVVLSKLEQGEFVDINPIDEAALLTHKRNLMNMRDKFADRASNPELTDAERQEGHRLWQQYEEAINRVDEATRAGGSSWGRWGNVRQIMLRDDYSVEAMERKARATKKRPLEPEEAAEIRKQAERIKELETKIEAIRKGEVAASPEDVEFEIDRIISENAPAPAASIGSIASKGKKAASEFTQAWHELLGGGRMGIKPTSPFNEVNYKAAKPHFDAAWTSAKEAGKDAVQFIKETVSKYGTGVKPYVARYVADAGLDLPNTRRAVQAADDAVAEMNATVEKTAKKGRKPVDVQKQRENIVERMQKKVSEAEDGETPDLSKMIQQLALNFVRGGVNKREPLISAVHSIVKDIDPALTREQTRDMISGYGDYRMLDKEPAKVTLRELKGEMQQIGKIEDMMGKQPPKKTGVERRTPSDEERKLIKEVNDLKRKGGFTVTDPETQLKSAMGAVKIRLKNEIADLDNAIASKSPLPGKKNELQYDAEATALKAQRDAKRAEYDTLFPKQPLTLEQQVQRAGKALDRSIAQLEQDIKGGVLYRKRGTKLASAELDAKRAKLDALRAERDLLRSKDTANLDAMALAAYKARTLRKIADLQERTAKGDFSPMKKSPRQIKMDAEATKLEYEAMKIKKAFNDARFLDSLANRDMNQKAWDATQEVVGTVRAVKSSIDLSAHGRQGALAILSHPIRSMKATRAMFKALRSEENEFKIMSELRNRPNAKDYDAAHLFLHDPTSPRLSSMEEAYRSRWAKKIPGVAASERAYTTFLNVLRADLYDTMHNALAKGGNDSLEAKRAIANYVNVATGRGSGKEFERAASVLSTTFWSPRFVASRFQYATGQPLWSKPFSNSADMKGARKVIATEYARSATGAALILGLASTIPGVSIGMDPRKSDFLHINVGKKHIDILGGNPQIYTLMSRIISGQTTRTSGETVDIRGDNVKYGQKDVYGVAGTFVRGKFSPVMQTITELATGTDAIGQPVSKTESLLKAAPPLNLVQIYEDLTEEGATSAAISALFNTFGVGIKTY